ncbi:MAG: hypothetical protein K2M17_02285 [Bacilli bacterium]|nr:hypothetical protein [Bacilli bacterium]
MDKQRAVSELNYFFSSLDKLSFEDENYSVAVEYLEKINDYFENLQKEEKLFNERKFRSLFLKFLGDISKRCNDDTLTRLKNEERNVQIVVTLLFIRQEFGRFIKTLKNERDLSDLLEEIDDFLLNYAEYMPICREFLQKLELVLFEEMSLKGGVKLFVQALNDNIELTPTLFIFYAMKKYRDFGDTSGYLAVNCRIKEAIFIDLDKAEIDVEQIYQESDTANATMLRNVEVLFSLTKAFVSKDLLQVQADAESLVDAAFRSLALSLGEYNQEKELFRIDYKINCMAAKMVVQDLSFWQVGNLMCYQVILEEKEKDWNRLFYQTKMDIRTTNSVGTKLQNMMNGHLDDSSVTNKIHKLEALLIDKGDIVLTEKEIKKAIIVLILEYLKGDMYGKAHQNLLRDVVVFDQEKLMKKYKSKSKVLQELVLAMETDYSKIDIVREISSLKEKEQMKPVLEKLLEDDDKLCNLSDLDIFEEIVMKSYSFYLANKDHVLVDCPYLFLFKDFDSNGDVSYLDMLISVFSQPLFLDIYHKKIMTVDLEIHPEISDLFKQYRTISSRVHAIYLKSNRKIAVRTK